MSSAVRVESAVSGEATSATFAPGGTRAAMSSSRRVAGPALIPIGQAYYWTRAWQEGEREAERELREGRGHVFPDMDAAITYLLSDEE